MLSIGDSTLQEVFIYLFINVCSPLNQVKTITVPILINLFIFSKAKSDGHDCPPSPFKSQSLDKNDVIKKLVIFLFSGTLYCSVYPQIEKIIICCSAECYIL